MNDWWVWYPALLHLLPYNIELHANATARLFPLHRPCTPTFCPQYRPPPSTLTCPFQYHTAVYTNWTTMPSPNEEDSCTPVDQAADPITNESLRDHTGSPEPKFPCVKDQGDPQKGPDGKFHCEILSKCSRLNFGTKYRLIRHEREVHLKHGGPKEMLSCTESGCSRSFKRRQNLNDHRRRLHGHQLQSVAWAAIRLSTPASSFLLEARTNNGFSNAIPTRANCSRTDSNVGSRDKIGDCKSEIQVLQEESSMRNDRIRRLEDARDSWDKRLAKAEETFARPTVGKLWGIQR